MKKAILASIIFALMATPALAVNTAVTYTSPILVLLFVGFCALIVVAQLVPAILMLVGATKAAAKSTKKQEMIHSSLDK